ncbi:MAG: hypothetical protein MAG431_01520 [Chloroflexi bacterium]|nr:hypothetical protein [Chloroflexota bacterium]
MGVLALRTTGMHALAEGPQSVGNTVCKIHPISNI